MALLEDQQWFLNVSHRNRTGATSDFGGHSRATNSDRRMQCHVSESVDEQYTCR